MIVAAPACRDTVTPFVRAATTQRPDMVPSQISCNEMTAAIHAKVGIAPEQGLVIKRGYVAVATLCAAGRPADGRNDGIDLDEASQAG